MGAKLVAEEGALKGLTFDLDQGEEWVGGRDPDECQLLIEDPSASRKHFLCRHTGDGYVLENLSETNPIQVNDEVVAESCILQAGDTLKVGETLFRFTPEGFEAVDEMTRAEEELEEEKEDMEGYYDTIFREEDAGEESVALAEIDFRLEDTGRWLMKVIAGPNTGAEFAMEADQTYVVGTDPEGCDIVLHDVSISRKHARFNIGSSSTIRIEDLKSRNGILVNDELVESSAELGSNSLVTIGTSTFMLIDREGSRETVISPPVAFMREKKEEEEKKKQKEEEEELTGEKQLEALAKEKEQKGSSAGVMLLIGLIAGVFIIVGMGTTALFREDQVIAESVDHDAQIAAALQDFPQIRYSYTPSTGRLLLIGHVTNLIDKNQILYNLQSQKYIQSVDDNIVVDEYVWQEANRVMGKNPSWRGVTIFSPDPGRFVMTGYLKTRAQEESLTDYINLNFPYLDLLERNVLVEENILSEVNKRLQDNQFIDITVQLTNGQLTLSGFLGFGKSPVLASLLQEFEGFQGIRGVRNFVVELAPEESMIDLSGEYSVTGYSDQGNANYSVVVNGKILQRGDSLDGMSITNIKPTQILLERDGFKFKIDYNK